MAGKLQNDFISDISSRLRDLPIRLPRNLGDNIIGTNKEKYLINLLQKDPGVFLERYGSELSQDERLNFHSLRLDDFEIDFYLKQLEGEDKDKQCLTRNRRVALMNRLEAQGEYFSEEAMKHRAPDLHKLHMGDASFSAASGPLEEGDMLSRLERQVLYQEERLAAQEASRQKQRQGSEQEEEEESSEEDEGGGRMADQGQSLGSHQEDADDLEQQEEASTADHDNDFEIFLSEMKSRFLAGGDGKYIDYAAVDADTSLDEDWAAIANQDAQERYFDAD